MCGIVGVFNTDGEPVAPPLLQRMTAKLAHRGPDGDGDYFDGGLGLGHRRLAIIDLTTAGRQPISSESGNVVASYNGEIYNFQKLRTELQGKGHRFVSRTDSEVVVHAYEEWGLDSLNRLNGMFAFALWDGDRQRLVLARDRFGIKPLYYLWDGRTLVFASEIKAILEHPAAPRRVGLSALNQYFTFQNTLTDETLFDEIRIVEAGHCLVLERAQSEPYTHKYWDFDLNRTIDISYAEAEEELYRLFTQAVTRQLVSDVPVSAYLSGGMDSGSIAAVASRHVDRLSTFTCGFDLTSASGLELGYDERAQAEAIAHFLKTEHYQVVLHAGDMEQVMEDLIWHLEDLRVGQCYPNYYVARLASKFGKVVLSGAGGDEMAAGYPWRYYRGSSSNSREEFHERYYQFWQRLVPDEEKSRLFEPGIWKQMQHLKPTSEIFRDVFEGSDLPPDATPENLVTLSLYFELKTFLHGLLVVEDRISMAHGLETRVPFLDYELVDFVQSLPVGFKLRNLTNPGHPVDENQPDKRRHYQIETGDGKMILRHAMSRIIPPEVTERAKQGFSAPDASWFRGESIDYINGLLRDRRARVYDYLQPSYVAGILDEHSSGSHNHRLLIWSLLSFEWWLRSFLN